MTETIPRCPHPGRAAVAKVVTIVPPALLAGCAQGGAPSFIIAGSYFPAWMACAFAGIFVALLLRIVLARLRIDAAIAYRLSFYSAVAVLVGAAIWLVGFGV